MPIDFNKIFQSKVFSGCILALVVLIILGLVFAAGTAVGFKKADFSYRFGDNYHKNFANGGCQAGRDIGAEIGAIAQGHPGMMGCANGGEYIDGHGVAGQIISIGADSIVIKDRDNVEKIISIDSKTLINRFMESIKISDLKAGDSVVIIGEPGTDSKISAKLIRVMPAPPTGNQPAAPTASSTEILK